MTTAATYETGTEATRLLLAQRVAAFAGVSGLINLVGLATRTLALVLWPEQLRFLPPGAILLQAGATGALFGIWALTRRGRGSRRYLRTVEALGLVTVSSCYVALAYQMVDVLTQVPQLRDLARDPDTGLLGLISMLTPTLGVSSILSYAMVLRACAGLLDLLETRRAQRDRT